MADIVVIVFILTSLIVGLLWHCLHLQQRLSALKRDYNDLYYMQFVDFLADYEAIGGAAINTKALLHAAKRGGVRNEKKF